MAEKEEAGFVVKDRRKVSLDDLDAQPEGGAAAQAPPETESAARAPEEAMRGQQVEDEVPLPEVSFSTFVFSLSTSALVHLGDIPAPGTEQVQADLPLAKQVIDTLGMLEEKTRGNLATDEERLLRSVLYDLRMRYVQKSQG